MSEVPESSKRVGVFDLVTELERANESLQSLQEALAALTKYEASLAELEKKPELTAEDIRMLLRSQEIISTLEEFAIAKYEEHRLDRAVVLELLTMSLRQLIIRLRQVKQEYEEAIEVHNSELAAQCLRELQKINEQIAKKEALVVQYRA